MQLPVAESKDRVWSWQLQATVAKKVIAVRSVLLNCLHGMLCSINGKMYVHI